MDRGSFGPDRTAGHQGAALTGRQAWRMEMDRGSSESGQLTMMAHEPGESWSGRLVTQGGTWTGGVLDSDSSPWWCMDRGIFVVNPAGPLGRSLGSNLAASKGLARSARESPRPAAWDAFAQFSLFSEPLGYLAVPGGRIGGRRLGDMDQAVFQVLPTSSAWSAQWTGGFLGESRGI